MGSENHGRGDYTSPHEQNTASTSADTQRAKDNVSQLSSMLEAEETPATHTDETIERLQAAGVKGMIAVAAAASVMGLTMMHPEKAGDVTPPAEPVPIVQMVDIPQPVIEREQKAPVEERKLTFVTSQVEFAERSWWHDVPAVSQQDLIYGGRETDYGCSPTAVSMVTEYWHRQDLNNETSSAQELLDKNVEQGIFTGDGMSVTYIHDELSALGYEAEDHANADLEKLKQEVAKGPVIAAVKLNMKTAGTNHSVVVTGISENNEVRVNDPWTGEARTYSWETFNASWSTLGRWLTTIRPS